MKYKNVFFDLDRTIWDFETNSKETFIEIFNKNSLHELCSFEEFYSEYRKINDNLWSMYRTGTISKEELSWKRFYLSMKAFGKDDIKTSKSMSEDYIKVSPTKTKLFPHSHEVLDYLSNKYNLFIITNGFKEVQYKKINNSKIDKYFKQIFTSEEVGCNKPNQEFFSFVLQETNSKVENSIVIGDDIEVDIKGAENLKIDTVWFNPNKQEAKYEPSYEINSLKELLDIL